MRLTVLVKDNFKSSVKGTFLASTLTTAFAALLATALYINENYSNPLTILSKYYLSIRGFAFGILVPIFVGAVTAVLIMVLKKVNSKMIKQRSLKFVIFSLLTIAYIPITFVGALIILYLGN